MALRFARIVSLHSHRAIYSTPEHGDRSYCSSVDLQRSVMQTSGENTAGADDYRS